MKRSLIVTFLIIIFISSCSILENKSIEWTWEWISPDWTSNHFTFLSDWNLYSRNIIFFERKDFRDKTFSLQYDFIDTVEPKQLYISIEFDWKFVRVPYWIYKIIWDELIIRKILGFEKSIWLFASWDIKYEFPTNFNWILTKYKRIN